MNASSSSLSFFFLSLGYIAIRLGSTAHARLLWSLRNRPDHRLSFLSPSVPVVMLLVLGALSASILYRQLGGYLLVQEVQDRIEEVADAADVVAAGAGTPRSRKELWRAQRQKHFHRYWKLKSPDSEDRIPQIEFNFAFRWRAV